jgi:methylisocitrate lyase
VAGLHIEDQVAPKRCGHLSGHQIVPLGEFAGKIRAAVEARQDPDLLIIARTDARAVSGFDDALNRARAYLDAGADMIFPEALETPAEFERFAREIPAPLIANMTEFGKSPLLTVEQLAGMGYRGVLFPVTIFRTVMKAAEMALRRLAAEGTQAKFLDTMQTRAELYDLLGYADFDERDRRYFGGK